MSNKFGLFKFNQQFMHDYNEVNKKEEQNNEEVYDSTKDTQKHIDKVAYYLNKIAEELIERGKNHDKSKLEEPEKSILDKYTPLLGTCEYNSDEYKKNSQEMKDLGFDKSHYSKNDHHLEQYENGLNDIDLPLLCEIFSDYLASSQRTKDGDFVKSMDIVEKKYKFPIELKNIFLNTYKKLNK